MLGELFPEVLRSEYDERVLNPKQRAAKAKQLRDALVAAGLWQSPKKILDVGCGSALILAALAAPNAQKVGFDIRVEPFLQAGVDRSSVTFIQGDAISLPVSVNAFDLVICLAVVGEFPDWRAAIQAMATRVAPGGILYVTVANSAILLRGYALAKKIGWHVPEGWWRYAQLCSRIANASVAVGFGLEGLIGWRYVEMTPHLARARWRVLRVVPLFLLSWMLKFGAPSFGYAWQKPKTKNPKSQSQDPKFQILNLESEI